MRTALNVVLILLVAVGLGYAVRYAQRLSVKDSTDISELSTERVGTTESAGTTGVIAPPDSGDSDLAAATAPPPPAENLEGLVTEFSLTERSGKQVTSVDLLGQPHIVSFFFSTCPSICVMQNQKLQQLQREFEGRNVRLVAITVDPETDTPERLQEYAQRFKADPEQWWFLTGDLLHIRRVSAEMYGVAADKQVHSERFILVDPTGKIAGYYSWSDERQFDKLQRDLRQMLDQAQGET